MNISNTNIQSKNLNLLTVLTALYESGSVTAASKKLGMSQPNFSRALKLLRQEFNDPLFVRTTTGFVPTQRAKDLITPLNEAMKCLEKVYTKTNFDIKSATGKFTISTTDYIEFLVAPKLIQLVAEEAPNLSVSFRPSHGFLTKLEMENGEHDLSILVVRETLPANFFKQELFTDPYVCAVRKGHPLLKTKITHQKYINYGHMLINPQGSQWAITDEKLQKMNLQRHIVFRTPNSLSAAACLAKTDLVLSATRRFVETAMQFFPIEIFECLFEIDPIQISQIWHERFHADPLNIWMRQKIKMLLIQK